jgi:hypothetical protein
MKASPILSSDREPPPPPPDETRATDVPGFEAFFLALPRGAAFLVAFLAIFFSCRLRLLAQLTRRAAVSTGDDIGPERHPVNCFAVLTL